MNGSMFEGQYNQELNSVFSVIQIPHLIICSWECYLHCQEATSLHRLDLLSQWPVNPCPAD